MSRRKSKISSPTSKPEKRSAPPVRLTEEDWTKVFAARCQSRNGLRLTREKQALVEAAYESDPERYEAMEPDVFNATVPHGSDVRWKTET